MLDKEMPNYWEDHKAYYLPQFELLVDVVKGVVLDMCSSVPGKIPSWGLRLTVGELEAELRSSMEVPHPVVWLMAKRPLVPSQSAAKAKSSTPPPPEPVRLAHPTKCTPVCGHI